MIGIPDWSLSALWLGFAACGTGIWIAGSALAQAADDLAERFRLARSIVGLLLLAVATSLPEIATTLSGATRGAAELVTGNLFGGIALQTTILAIADLWARGPLTGMPRKANHTLEALLLVGLLSLTLTALLLREPFAVLHVGIGSIAAGLAYAACIALLRRYDGATDWVPVNLPDPVPLFERERPQIATGVILLRTGACCLAILCLGLLLIAIAETLALRSGLGAGFLGVTLLAAATSLPELTTTIAAVRMGAHGLAISNVFGSNLIMLGLILPADLLYRPGPILRDADATASLSIAFGIGVTTVYLIGMTVRRKPAIGRLGVDSVAVVLLYGISLWAYWLLR